MRVQWVKEPKYNKYAQDSRKKINRNDLKWKEGKWIVVVVSLTRKRKNKKLFHWIAFAWNIKQKLFNKKQKTDRSNERIWSTMNPLCWIFWCFFLLFHFIHSSHWILFSFRVVVVWWKFTSIFKRSFEFSILTFFLSLFKNLFNFTIVENEFYIKKSKINAYQVK